MEGDVLTLLVAARQTVLVFVPQHTAVRKFPSIRILTERNLRRSHCRKHNFISF
jgi:hypothetical protein